LRIKVGDIVLLQLLDNKHVVSPAWPGNSAHRPVS
jgi:hypothetical protein